MGDVADMMLDGTLCQGCGEFIGEDFPSYCGSCLSIGDERAGQKAAQPAVKVECSVCQRRIKPVGLKDHMRDAHGITSSSTRAGVNLLPALKVE